MRQSKQSWLLVSMVLAGSFLSTVVWAQPSWEEIQKLYIYDAKVPLNAVEEKVMETEEAITLKVHFDSANKERPVGLLVLPKQGKAPHPLVLLLHPLGANKEAMGRLASELAKKGLASLALDAPAHGERAEKAPPELTSRTALGMQRRFIQAVIDYRRALDYLSTRKDVDMQHIGALGVSMGGFTVVLLAAVDERVKAIVVEAAGGDWLTITRKAVGAVGERLREQIGLEPTEEIKRLVATIDPLNFIARLKGRPLLIQHGKNDEIVPPECAQKLFDAAHPPKEIQWFDSDHSLPPEARDEAVMWLFEKLKGKL